MEWSLSYIIIYVNRNKECGESFVLIENNKILDIVNFWRKTREGKKYHFFQIFLSNIKKGGEK